MLLVTAITPKVFATRANTDRVAVSYSDRLRAELKKLKKEKKEVKDLYIHYRRLVREHCQPEEKIHCALYKAKAKDAKRQYVAISISQDEVMQELILENEDPENENNFEIVESKLVIEMKENPQAKRDSINERLGGHGEFDVF